MNPVTVRPRPAQLRLLSGLEFALGLGALLVLLLGPKGVGNPWFLTLSCLGTVVNALRNVTAYRLMDEYQRSLMLRAIATAFIFLMLGLFVTALVGAFSVAESISPLVAMALFLMAWAVFAITHSVMQRREASED